MAKSKQISPPLESTSYKQPYLLRLHAMCVWIKKKWGNEYCFFCEVYSLKFDEYTLILLGDLDSWIPDSKVHEANMGLICGIKIESFKKFKFEWKTSIYMGL